MKGLYKKYTITRNDGTEVTDRYFVLKLNDKHALKALQAYADSCRYDNPVLAQDIDLLLVSKLEK